MLPISQMSGVEKKQMVAPSRALRLQLITPLIFSMLGAERACVRKLLLWEALTRMCPEPFRISELTLTPTVTP